MTDQTSTIQDLLSQLASLNADDLKALLNSEAVKGKAKAALKADKREAAPDAFDQLRGVMSESNVPARLLEIISANAPAVADGYVLVQFSAYRNAAGEWAMSETKGHPFAVLNPTGEVKENQAIFIKDSTRAFTSRVKALRAVGGVPAGSYLVKHCEALNLVVDDRSLATILDDVVIATGERYHAEQPAKKVEAVKSARDAAAGRPAK